MPTHPQGLRNAGCSREREVLKVHTEDGDSGFPSGPDLTLYLNKQGSERKMGPRMGGYRRLCLLDWALCVHVCARVHVCVWV